MDNYDIVNVVQNSKCSPNLIVAMMFMLYLLLETLFILVFIGYDLDNPYIFHHVIIGYLPKAFLKQGDVLFPALYVTSVFVYFKWMFDDMAHAEYIMFLKEKDSKILVSIRNKGKNCLKLLNLIQFNY